MDDVKSSTAQTSKNGAVTIVPRLSQAQQIDVTIATKFDDVVEFVQQ
jgi:hypothetical protein